MHDLKMIQNLEQQVLNANYTLDMWLNAYDELVLKGKKLEKQLERAEYVRKQQLQFIEKLTQEFMNYE